MTSDLMVSARQGLCPQEGTARFGTSLYDTKVRRSHLGFLVADLNRPVDGKAVLLWESTYPRDVVFCALVERAL
jgi:hypothetical protein